MGVPAYLDRRISAAVEEVLAMVGGREKMESRDENERKSTNVASAFRNSFHARQQPFKGARRHPKTIDEVV